MNDVALGATDGPTILDCIWIIWQRSCEYCDCSLRLGCLLLEVSDRPFDARPECGIL